MGQGASVTGGPWAQQASPAPGEPADRARRGWLAAAAGCVSAACVPAAYVSAALPLAGCAPAPGAHYDGGWVGAEHARGHRLRAARGAAASEPTRASAPAAAAAPAIVRRTAVLIVGAGIAGLACARALVRAGIDDFRLLDLEDAAGGNSRGHRMGGIGCPLGAHYLPLPGPAAVEVAEWLEEIGLRRVEAGRAVYDERHLCHTPQERLHIDGAWHEGLLPPVDALPAAEQEATLAQYRRCAERMAALGAGGAFAIPTARSRWHPGLDALDRRSFADWLDAEGLTAPALRWYLDHCCRDDYGAGAAQVSAWAGLHYFASRHGFHAPGADDADRDPVLTWAQGNAWLAARLAAPFADRLSTGCVVERVDEVRHAVTADAWNVREQRAERWIAGHVVLAVPLFVARRLLAAPPAALDDAVARMAWAPWLVANVQLDAPPDDRPGAPPSWDNVAYGSASLGYVDAMHQDLRPVAGPTVLTAYRALGGDDPAVTLANRRRLLALPWADGAADVLRELAALHPDLPPKVRRIDLMRYGHAMSIPRPGVRSSAALHALAPGGPAAAGRVRYAHADLAAYSVFEEAFHAGTEAASALRDRR